MIIIGDYVVYCAPKTGVTTFTHMARKRGYEHEKVNDKAPWHTVTIQQAYGRTPVLMVREPKARMISLWAHYLRDNPRQTSLLETYQETLREGSWWNQNLVQFYGPLLNRPYELIRLESFAEDVYRLFGWRNPERRNVNKHPTVQDLAEELEQAKGWWQPDQVLFGY